MRKSVSKIVVGILIIIFIFGLTSCSSNNEIIKDNQSKTTEFAYKEKDIVKVSKLAKRLKTDFDFNVPDYSRYEFGDNWQNANTYGFSNVPKSCNVRYAMLILYGKNVNYNNGCKIFSGVWISIYNNQEYTSKSDIQIDHIVPLKNAWENGAYKWSKSKRIQFANDKDELAISDKENNLEKSDSSIDEWMPEYNGCIYTIKYTKIKFKYNIKATSTEKDKILENLDKCLSLEEGDFN